MGKFFCFVFGDSAISKLQAIASSSSPQLRAQSEKYFLNFPLNFIQLLLSWWALGIWGQICPNVGEFHRLRRQAVCTKSGRNRRIRLDKSCQPLELQGCTFPRTSEYGNSHGCRLKCWSSEAHQTWACQTAWRSKRRSGGGRSLVVVQIQRKRWGLRP